MACVEDNPWKLLPKEPKSVEHFSVFCTSLEAKFAYLGLPDPGIRNIRDQSEIYPIYCAHLRNLFSCRLLGFKSTMMSLRDIQAHVSNGAKVLLMRRDPEKILRSWVGRISPELKSAEFRLSSYLRSINHYDIPPHLVDYVHVLNYSDLITDPGNCLRGLSEFLGSDLCMPSTRYHSYNKGRAPFERNDSSSFVATALGGDGRCRGEFLVNRLPKLYNNNDFEVSAQKVSNGLSVLGVIRHSLREPFVKVARRVYSSL
jgi:hypothetical protein